MTHPHNPVLTPLALALALGTAAPAVLGQSERILDTQAGWTYFYGANATTINDQVSSGLRPFSLERTALGEYDTVTVANSGPYAMPGAFVTYGRSPASMETYLSSNNLRLLDLEVYDNSGSTFMTAVVVPNTGSTSTPAWGWLYNTSFNSIVTWLNNNPSLRLIDLDCYTIGGTRYYSAVAVHNSGSNYQSGWWYMAGATASQITTELTNNDARLIQIDLVSPGSLLTPATYAALMVSSNPGGGWWYPSLTSAQVAEQLNQNGARLTAFKRYTNYLGQERWAVAMVDNANPQTRRMRQYMDSALSDGSYGFMLRQVGGPVLADLNANFVFEPASVMKILHATYAVRRCSQGLDNLTSDIYVHNTCNDETNRNRCPDPVFYCNQGNEPLRDCIEWMMRISHNGRTRNIEERYGRATLNSFADNTLGLTNTQINHTLGCLCGEPHNTTTAADMSSLYEQINDNSLFSGAWRDTLGDMMGSLDLYGYDDYPTLSNVINQEAAQTNLTATEIAQFRAAMQLVNKGGGYGCSGTVWKTDAGWAEIPFKVSLLGTYVSVTRRYAFSTFVHGCTNSTAANVAYRAKEELLREQVREALESWDNACVTPGILADPSNASAPLGGSANFSANVLGTVGAYTYQWQRQPGNVGSWVNVTNAAGHFSGATTTTLTVSNIVAGDAGGYRLRVSSDCGTEWSDGATLTIGGPANCYANCDNSTASPVLNVADFTCFLQRFAAGQSYANCDNSTAAPTLNVADFTCFLQRFAAGCP